MKLLFLSDIHLGKSYELMSDPGYFRQANTETENALKEIIPNLNQKDFDYFINMGDLFCELEDFLEKDPEIRREGNLKNLNLSLDLIKQIRFPQIHIEGNHDLNSFSKIEFSNLFLANSILPKFYGSKIIENIKIIWLDIEKNPEGYFQISENRLAWLKKELLYSGKIIVLSHYPILETSLEGQVYFGSIPDRYLLQNASSVLEILEANENVLGYFCGHTHWLGMKNKGNFKQFLVPSFSENIAGMEFPTNHPKVYSTLEIRPNLLIFKSFSNKYCFFNLEIEIP